MSDSINKISEDRWKLAQSGEKSHWEIILSNESLTNNEDGYYRHAKVMLLDVDQPSGLSVIDVGGGPLSLTLHHTLSNVVVVDPIEVSGKQLENYLSRGTQFVNQTAECFLENYSGEVFDEVWMYNCLQHVIDPVFIFENLYKIGKVLRISEPTNTPVNQLHPHTFTPDWYYYKLQDISSSGSWKRVNYDYPYVGGKWILKRND